MTMVVREISSSMYGNTAVPNECLLVHVENLKPGMRSLDSAVQERICTGSIFALTSLRGTATDVGERMFRQDVESRHTISHPLS
jgi:hypothetical protein